MATRISVLTGLLLLLLLTAVAGYSFSQIRILSLPIPQGFAIFSILLPLFTVISTRIAHHLLRTYPSQARPILYLAIFAFQLIYETIIATLSLTYMAPGCRLDRKWATLYSNKDANAIRRIQDTFECCGFNSVVDRAWPFPHGRPGDGFGADQCQRMYKRIRSCVGPWRQAEQVNAGLFFTVAIVIFTVKVIVLIFQSTRSLQSFPLLAAGDLEDAHSPNNRGSERRMIGEDQPLAEDRYRDEVDGSQDESAGAENATGNSSRPRVELSRLLATDGDEPR